MITNKATDDHLPAFPNAHVYLGRADWERPETQADRTTLGSTVNENLEPLWQRQRLVLVDGDLDLGNGVQIMATPGETPGHQIVRVESAGALLYCLGDLYHHPIEVAHPEQSVFWVDAEINQRSRQKFVAAALPENATLIATHIRGMGRLTNANPAIRWVAESRYTEQGHS